MSKPTIAQIGKYYPPVKGGMEIVLKTLVEYLKTSFRLIVLVSNTRAVTQTDESSAATVVRLARFGTWFSQPLTLSVFNRLRRIKADLIHVHLPNPLIALAYLIVRPQGKLIVSYHAEIRRQRILSFLYRPLVTALFLRAEAIVITSANMIDVSRLLSRFKNKCVVIPYGIELSRFALTPEITRQAARLREHAGKPIILFVGRLVYYKGLKYLLKAMKTIDAQLIIVGKGRLGFSLRACARRYGVSHKIIWAGEIDDSRLPAYYHASELFVLPSSETSESFSLAMLEAFACSRPVVSSNLPTSVTFVNVNGKTGLTVPVKDSRALARAINTLLRNDAMRREFGAYGRRRVETEFTAQKMGEQVASLYNAVIKER